MQWKNVYVFISSTFSDMHAERDYLVKNVFPELSEWCEERRIRLVDIDLRWGVTRADSEAKNTLLACLKNIDECRPFFLCFLGARRGWVPVPTDVSEATIKDYPGLEPYLGKSSVTEMEIEHALLSPMLRMTGDDESFPSPVSHALFYMRKDDYLANLTELQKMIYTNAGLSDAERQDAELASLKDRIKRRSDKVTEYDCRFDTGMVSSELLSEGNEAASGRLTDFSAGGRPLRELIIESLKAEIEKEYPAQAFRELSALEAGLEQQELFMERSREGYIPRSGDFDELNAYISGLGNGLFILYAPTGLGKTMLLSNFAAMLRTIGKKVTARFCGASDLFTDGYGLWKSVFGEYEIDCPPNYSELRCNIAALLSALAEKGENIIFLDAVNQLSDGAEMLTWLPRALPAGLKILISIKKDETSLPLIERFKSESGVTVSAVHPFTDKKDRYALIEAYLERYFKALDESLKQLLCGLPATENPLYLKVLLSELRVFGAFGQLENEIRSFGENPEDAFIRVLERLETDTASSEVPSREAVSALFGLLVCARHGLSEDELTFCFKKIFPAQPEELLRETLRLYIRQLRPFLARRQGRTDFLYESFLLAASKRYKDSAARNHSLLCECFLSSADPSGSSRFDGGSARGFAELPYHLFRAGRGDELRRLLADYLWLSSKLRLCGVASAISDYAFLEDPEKALRPISEFLRLSSSALNADPSRFFDRLWGHLCESENASAKALLAQSKKEAGRVWLRPLRCVWSPPCEGQSAVFEVEKSYSPPYPILFDDKLFCINTSGSVTIFDINDGSSNTFSRLCGGAVNGVALDGNRVIFASTGFGFSAPELWDLPEGRPIALPAELKDCSGPLLFMGNRLIARSGAQSLGIFDKDNFEPLGTIALEHGPTRLAAVGGALAVGFGSSGDIGIYDVENCRCLRILCGHYDTILALCVCGGHLVSGSSDGKTRIWNAETGVCEKIINKVTSGIRVFNGKMYTHGGWDGNVWVWDPDSFEVIDSMKGHGKAIVSMSLRGSILATSANDGTVRLWDLASSHSFKELDRHIWGVYTLLLHGGLLLSGSGDRTIKAWNSNTMDCLATLSGHTEQVSGLAASGTLLISASNDGLIKAWSLENVNSSKTLSVRDAVLTSVAMYDKDSLLAGALDGTLYHIAFSSKMKDYHPHEGAINKIIVWNKWVYTCSNDGTVAIIETKSLKVRHRLPHSGLKVLDMLLQDDFMFTACSDGSIRVWDLKDCSFVKSLVGHKGAVNALVICGVRLVSGSSDRTIKVWNLETGDCLKTYTYDFEILSLASNLDNLYVGTDDGRVFWFGLVDG